MLHLRNSLIAAFVIFLPVQDLGSRNTAVGVFGTSLSVVPLVALAVLSFIVWLYRGEWRISWAFIGVVAYVIVVNAVSLLRFGPTALGVNLFSKCISLGIITALWSFVIFGIDYLSVPRFGRFVQFAYVIVLLSVALGDLNLGNLGFLVNNGLLHGTVNADMRWRGLSSEVSLFAPMVINLGLVAAQYSKTFFTKALLGVSSVLILVISGSKGAIVALLLTMVLLAIAGGLRLRTLVVGALCSAPIVVFAITQIPAIASQDLLQETTTVATRATMMLWGLRNVVFNPFGVGFGGFYATLGPSIPTAMDIVYRYSPIPLNFSEVQDYAVSAENASTKIFLLNYALFVGLPVLVCVAYTLWKRMRALSIKQHFLLIAAVCYTTFALGTAVDLPTAYNLFFVFGVALNEAGRADAFPSGDTVALYPE